VEKDLEDTDLEKALTDMGSFVQYVPVFLDGCSQDKLASLVRLIFPSLCLKAIGGMVKEIGTIDHHITHLEWLKDHALDFTKALTTLKSSCSALSFLKGK
jgi:hypothetical protein